MARKYFPRHPQIYNQRNGRRHTRISRNKDAIRERLLREDGPYCWWCGSPFDLDFPPTIDHLTPWQMGGSNHADNLVLACEPCNQYRGMRPDWCVACGVLFTNSFQYARCVWVGRRFPFHSDCLPEGCTPDDAVRILIARLDTFNL